MDAELSKALTDLLMALISVAILLLTRVAIPWVTAHTSEKHVEIARSLALQAVLAVEQMGATAGWTPQQKLDDAITRFRVTVDKHGLQLTDVQVRTLIEQAVLEMHQVGWNAPAKVAPVRAKPKTKPAAVAVEGTAT